MTFLERLLLQEVPAEEQPIVELFRHYINDTAELNTLEAIQESTDLEIYRYLYSALDQINNAYSFTTDFRSLKDFPSWTILRDGAILQMLNAKGILSARNTLTYQDAGGVTVQDYDKYGRYVNYFNILITAYRNAVMSIKIEMNANAAYGGVASEYSHNYLNPYGY